nr:hypothetical protein [Paenibacillus bovis]
MNDLADVKRIVEQYLVKGGQILENATELSAPKQVEQLWTEGLSKLDSLKLSADDRRNFRLLRQAFKSAIRAAQALQKGQFRKAESLTEEYIDYSQRYNAAFISRAVSKL